jgi:hypothetical protein
MNFILSIYYKESIYDMLKQKNIYVKKIARKKLTTFFLWTLEWPKMSYIFINPYDNHFGFQFFYIFNMYIFKKFRMATLHMGFLVH